MQAQSLLERLASGYEYDPHYGEVAGERDRLKAENAELRKLCSRFAKEVIQYRCNGCVCKRRCDDGLFHECRKRGEIREMARELGIDVDDD